MNIDYNEFMRRVFTGSKIRERYRIIFLNDSKTGELWYCVCRLSPHDVNDIDFMLDNKVQEWRLAGC